MEPAWSRFLSPVLRLRNILTPGPGRPGGDAGVLRLARALPTALGARRRARLPDRAARRAGRGDGPRARQPLGLVERRRHRLHGEARRRLPAERGLSGRLRHADQRLDHPLPLPGGVRAGRSSSLPARSCPSRSCCRRPRTSSRRATGSGSTSRRRTSPGSSGTRTPASRSAGTRTRSSPSRPSTPTRSTRRTSSCRSFLRERLGSCGPGRPVPDGDRPRRRYPPDEDETPRRVVSVEGFRIGRTPVTGDDGVPVTYVSRDEAEAFCAANGVRLPTEIEWEAAARGGDDRLWPWGDELPDTTRATFGQGIGGPSPAGLASGRRGALRRAGPGGQRLRVDGRRRGARRLVPERARRAALLGAAARCILRRAIPTSASASSPSSRAGASTGSRCRPATT